MIGLVRRLCIIGLAALAAPGHAFDISLPVGAILTVERATTLDSFDAPVGAFADGVVPVVTLEGAITRRAWRIPTGGLTPLQVMLPLRENLIELGYEPVFECASEACGGFDFRFATEVLPGPNMYVNISRYRYLTAFLGSREAPARAVGVLVSVTSASAYVQVILADTGVDVEDLLPDRQVSPVEPTGLPDVATNGGATEDKLLENGFLILRDLDFATGTSDLGPGPYASLDRLAALLKVRADLRVALVGHTDTVGGLAPNIELSRARARSVRARLIEDYGISADRLDAEGMGYLAPVASNLTPEGREQNRRVEAVLLNME
jgi:OOP family OmpA-OmpF porin